MKFTSEELGTLSSALSSLSRYSLSPLESEPEIDLTQTTGDFMRAVLRAHYDRLYPLEEDRPSKSSTRNLLEKLTRGY